MDADLAQKAVERWGTPLYVYDGERIQTQYGKFQKAVASHYGDVAVCYAVKANTSLAILSILRKLGASVDIVSLGELDAALRSGFHPEGIIYTSNGKSDFDLEAAAESGIVINLDNTSELERLIAISERLEAPPRVSFRINPDIDAHTHPKIATALASSKFGLPVAGDVALDAYRQALASDSLDVVGVHTHIGSQIADVAAFRELGEKMARFITALDGELGFAPRIVDVGGGLGIAYHKEKMPSPQAYARAVIAPLKESFKEIGITPSLWFEPGRFLVGEAGILLTRVTSVKESKQVSYINVDAGFNDLVRPAMYDAHHEVSVVGSDGTKAIKTYCIAGNLCESGDILARDRKLPRVKAGDLIAIHDAGAYGMSMASTYNSMPLPAEVLVLDGGLHLIRERQKIEDLYARQRIPSSLER